MATIRFGKACDTCPRAYPDYNSGSDIGTCEDCQADLCTSCARETGHSRMETEGRIFLSCA